MTPTVSVVTAAKNYARFLPAAVESVFAQTFTDWELVVVDDGSTDDTPAVMARYADGERVRYIRTDRLGISRAKNLGPRLARGKYLALLDADDTWRPTKLQKQLALMKSRPGVGLCFTRRELMDESGRVRPTADAPYPSELSANTLLGRNYICYSSVLVRRDLFDASGGFCPAWDSAVDYDLWLRLSRMTELAFVDEELTLYRTGHGSVSGRLRDRVATGRAIVRRWSERWGYGEELAPGVLAREYASQEASLGYLLRDAEPRCAARHYLRALAAPGERKGALRGLAACARGVLRGGSVAAANRGENR